MTDPFLQNVLKGAIGSAIKEGITSIEDLKKKTKIGTGCGGCMPLFLGIRKVRYLHTSH